MANQARRPMLVPGGAAALGGCGCLGASGFMLENGARSWGAWGWVPYALIVAGLGCFVLAGVQGKRANAGKRKVAARPSSRSSLRAALVVFSIGFVAFGALAAFGGYLLHQRDTGPHIQVTVTRCELIDSGPSRSASTHDYCYGSWTYAGKKYVDKYVQGAGLDDEDHVIDATLHGDTAYSRDLQTPLILLGVFGTASLLLLGVWISTFRQFRRAAA